MTEVTVEQAEGQLRGLIDRAIDGDDVFIREGTDRAVRLVPEPIGVRDLADHHRDPFDRLLISQAICDGIPIAGIDAVFEDYGVRRIW